MDERALFEEMQEVIIRGESDRAMELARRGIDEGLEIQRMLDEGFVKGIYRVGEMWEQGEFFLPELVRGAETMKAAMSVVEPVIAAAGQERKRLGRAVIGTVEGDIHDIGKSLVAAMMTAYGFEVMDLGADVPLGRFIDKAAEAEADLICLSALLTTTMVGQKTVVELARDRGLKAMVMVGGAPVSSAWAEEIGADGYAESAVSAVEKAKQLVSRSGD